MLRHTLPTRAAEREDRRMGSPAIAGTMSVAGDRAPSDQESCASTCFAATMSCTATPVMSQTVI